MKIVRTYPFWTWLMRYAYRHVKKDLGKFGMGVPHLRDPENKCDWYSPRKPKPTDHVKAECETDGHYLCKECIFNANHPAYRKK